MPLAALGLVIVAAFLHAGWNALAKRTPQRLALLWSAMLLGSPMALLLVTLLFEVPLVPAQGRVELACSALVHAAYFYALSRAYQADLSLAYPLARGLAVGLAPLAAWLWLNEHVSLAGAVGIACIMIGGGAVGASSRLSTWLQRRATGGADTAAPRPVPEPSEDERRRQAQARSGMRWALFGGVTVATYSLIDAEGSRQVHPLVYLAWMGAGSALAMLPLMWRRRRDLFALWRARFGITVAVAAMSMGAYLLVLAAFRMAATGYVVACRELSIVASVLFGWLWLREPHGRIRLLGALLIVCGAAAITLLG